MMNRLWRKDVEDVPTNSVYNGDDELEGKSDRPYSPTHFDDEEKMPAVVFSQNSSASSTQSRPLPYPNVVGRSLRSLGRTECVPVGGTNRLLTPSQSQMGKHIAKLHGRQRRFFENNAQALFSEHVNDGEWSRDDFKRVLDDVITWATSNHLSILYLNKLEDNPSHVLKVLGERYTQYYLGQSSDAFLDACRFFLKEEFFYVCHLTNLASCIDPAVSQVFYNAFAIQVAFQEGVLGRFLGLHNVIWADSPVYAPEPTPSHLVDCLPKPSHNQINASQMLTRVFKQFFNDSIQERRTLQRQTKLSCCNPSEMCVSDIQAIQTTIKAIKRDCAHHPSLRLEDDADAFGENRSNDPFDLLWLQSLQRNVNTQIISKQKALKDYLPQLVADLLLSPIVPKLDDLYRFDQHPELSEKMERHLFAQRLEHLLNRGGASMDKRELSEHEARHSNRGAPTLRQIILTRRNSLKQVSSLNQDQENAMLFLDDLLSNDLNHSQRRTAFDVNISKDRLYSRYHEKVFKQLAEIESKLNHFLPSPSHSPEMEKQRYIFMGLSGLFCLLSLCNLFFYLFEVGFYVQALFTLSFMISIVFVLLAFASLAWSLTLHLRNDSPPGALVTDMSSNLFSDENEIVAPLIQKSSINPDAVNSTKHATHQQLLLSRIPTDIAQSLELSSSTSESKEQAEEKRPFLTLPPLPLHVIQSSSLPPRLEQLSLSFAMQSHRANAGSNINRSGQLSSSSSNHSLERKKAHSVPPSQATETDGKAEEKDVRLSPFPKLIQLKFKSYSNAIEQKLLKMKPRKKTAKSAPRRAPTMGHARQLVTQVVQKTLTSVNILSNQRKGSDSDVVTNHDSVDVCDVRILTEQGHESEDEGMVFLQTPADDDGSSLAVSPYERAASVASDNKVIR